MNERSPYGRKVHRTVWNRSLRRWVLACLSNATPLHRFAADGWGEGTTEPVTCAHCLRVPS